MSGHSKWSTIKRQKGVADTRRSALFSKLARQITIAAKSGKDPDMNFRLRLAIDRARAMNMPNDNIERAVNTGSADGKDIKDAIYEAFGPGRVGIMIQASTDNPNRTTGELRSLLSKHGGSLEAANSVAWMFRLCGVLRIPTNLVSETDWEGTELALIDAGAEDVRREEDEIVVETNPANLAKVRAALTELHITPKEVGLEFVPTTNATLDTDAQEKLFALFEALDEHPDVNSFASNEE